MQFNNENDYFDEFDGKQEQPSRLGPRQLFQGLRRHFWIVLVVPTLALGLGWAYYKRQAPTFQGMSVLEIDGTHKVLRVQGVDEIDLKDDAQVNTLVQQVASRRVLARVVEQQRYHFSKEWIGDQTAGSVEAEVHALELLRGKVNTRLRAKTRFIDISVLDTSPLMCAEIANAVARAAIEELDASRQTVNESATGFLLQEADRLRERLKKSELALQAYKEENDAISLDEKKDLVLTKLKDLSGQLLAASARRLQLETELEACRKGTLNESELLGIPTVASHPKVAATMSQLSRLRSEMDVMKERYKFKHPKYVALQAEIDSANAQLSSFLGEVVGLLESAMVGAHSLEAKLKAELQLQEADVFELEKLAVQYNSLRRDMETDSAVFQSVLSRLKEVDVAQSQDRPPLRLQQVAETPLSPVAPKASLVLGGALMGGVTLAGGMIVLLILLDSKVRSAADAQEQFRLPVLGVVGEEKALPALAGGESATDGASAQPLQVLGSGVAPSEAFRTLRNMVSLLGKKDAPRTILITSALPGEGKTYCASRLARSFAAQGTRTLVIDADLRRPNLFRDVGGERGAAGLSDILLGNSNLTECIKSGLTTNLWVLSAGARVPNPGELMGSKQALRWVLEEVKRIGFERIIIDSAPLIPVSDTLLLADLADTVLMVVACNQTAVVATQHALKQLSDIGKRASGLVLNRYKHVDHSYYMYDRYYSYYQKQHAEASSQAA